MGIILNLCSAQVSNLPKSLTSFIWHFLLPLKYYFCGVILVMCMSATMVAFDGYIAKYFIDNITSATPRSIAFLVFIYVAWWEAINLSWRCYDYLMIKIIPVLKVNIINALTGHVLNHSHQFFQDNFIGSVSNKIGEMAKSVGSIMEIFSQILRKVLMIVFSLVALYFAHPIFTLIMFIWSLVFITTNLYLMKYIEQYARKFAESRSSTFGKIVDIMNNITNVRFFSNKHYELNYLQKSLDQTMDHDIVLHKFELKINYLKGMLNNILIGVMVYYLCVLYFEHLITIGDFSLILIICIAVSTETWELAQEVSKFTEELGICNQALAIITEPHAIVDTEQADSLIVKKGEIVFDQIEFSYNHEQPLFEKFSLTIKAGSKIGLVGYSGSGKSSLVSLIVRLFEVSNGEILIDQQNINNVTQSSLRQNIAFIPQDPILFHRSLIENIRYGRLYASDEEVIEAAKLAEAHDFIMATGNCYDTLVGDRGSKLSGGQRQRIAIARAILKDAPILILDEATSSLDSATELTIQASLKQLMQARTTIVIAHRLSTLLHMDKIVVLDKGKITETGTHQELLAKDGLYASLWHKQVNGFIDDQ